ncbi:putative U6 snRNA-associated Sm-like protein [Hamiltosporidium tvaerminnensis]|uniref:Putative U6 snRNA-associated Sm-like protein n=2 Tax=Hamiltosporidium TaxID=1176354 RepID=A0A4V2JXK6_9MICR|nr:hypothetical protein LUQ84_001693 [Hamiltosporidium tvaerminnensis]TBU00295.1 putative U6 snRNA-associated Sm-like protein [Hamiltosporidium tvaerminnensis]TBU02094.1 putative U6 snRNA-associated Sm-like protein [Hamiltosporidium magnivora]TBU12192.1 putative U6 snRNA-associated Sm-like protein [Hamiltosporidium tvaerminnensis]
MYPLTLIRISKGKNIEVELKNNDIYEGQLIECDLLMNMHLSTVVVKSLSKDPYFLEDCFLKGSVIKFVKLKENAMNKQEILEKRSQKNKVK